MVNIRGRRGRTPSPEIMSHNLGRRVRGLGYRIPHSEGGFFTIAEQQVSGVADSWKSEHIKHDSRQV